MPVRDLPRHRGLTRYSILENFFFPNLNPSRRPYPPRHRYGRRPPCPDRGGRTRGKKKIFNLDATAVTDAYDAYPDRRSASGEPREKKNFDTAEVPRSAGDAIRAQGKRHGRSAVSG